MTAVLLLHSELLDLTGIPATTTTTTAVPIAHDTLAHDTLAHDTLAHDTLAHGTLAHGTPDPARLGRPGRPGLAADRQPAELAPSGHLRVPFGSRANAMDMSAARTGAPAPVWRLPTPPVPASAGEDTRFHASEPPPPDTSDAVAALGLPRRVPKQHLADGLRRGPAGPSAQSRPAREDWPKPSPEEIKKMLSGYQIGFDRGREEGHGHHSAPGNWASGGASVSPSASGGARNNDRAAFGGDNDHAASGGEP